MAYQALYRKYRPKRFADVIGQEHITTILKNQIVEGHVAHAYLFTGTRGTGKTSTAKIFARALNCEHPEAGEPCGTCASCRIAEAGGVDIIELDAASNTGVEDMRALIDKARFAPLDLSVKVYIIDEAHMLSKSAFNALLKTLEEPPSSAVFLLTGNIAGVLPTVASRCAVIRVGLSTAAEIEALLLARGAPPAAARLYAAASGGSETRALRLYEDEAFRTLRADSFAALTALLRGELPLGATKKLCANRGAADAFAFMLSFLRDLLARCAETGAAPENPDQRDAVAALAARFTTGRVTGMIEMLAKATNELYAASAGALMDLAVADRLFLELSEAVTNQ